MARKTIMHRFCTPELLAQVNPENLALQKEFLLYLKSIQRSHGTILQYECALNIWAVWNLQNNDNKAFKDISKRSIIAFQNWMVTENSSSPARVRLVKSALSSLSNYIEAIVADDDPAYKNFRPIIRKIENPTNNPVRDKTVLTDEQCKKLLDTLCEKKCYKQACVVALAMYSGRRKAELVRFKVSDFDDSNIIYGTLYKTPRKIRTKGTGRGKMLVCYTLAKQFKPYFDLWMAERERLGITSEWLFPDANDPKMQMNPHLISGWTDKFSRILGVNLYMHSLRHYFATYLSRSGLPDDLIQFIIGWSDIGMVSVYKDIDKDGELGKYFSNGEIVAKEDKSVSDL